MHRWLALGCLLLATTAGRADDVQTGFVPKVYKGESKYIVFVPHDYKGDKEYPLILFLHGAGERGDDGEVQVKQGLGPVIKFKNIEKQFPFIAVFPQCAKNSNWKADSPD